MKKKKKRRVQKSKPTQPRPLPLRFMLIAIAIIAFAVLFPLFAVWKQAYITSSSKLQEELTDSISVLSSKESGLRLKAERLSANERIESIARESLDLHYPSSKQIVIVRPEAKPRRASIINWKFLAVLRKSFLQEKG